MARQHAVATICTAVPMVTSVTWLLRRVTQNCSLFHSWRKYKPLTGKLARSLKPICFPALHTDFACSYQFCNFGHFLWSFGSYNSIFLSAWNVKYLSSCSFRYPFFPQHYFDTVCCYDVYRVASSVVCPGGRSQCPQNQTCCPSTSGGYVCCPDPKVSIFSSFLQPFRVLPNHCKCSDLFVKGDEIE